MEGKKKKKKQKPFLQVGWETEFKMDKKSRVVLLGEFRV